MSNCSKDLRFDTYYHNRFNDLYYIIRSDNPEKVLFCREPFKGDKVESEMSVSHLATMLLMGDLVEAVF